MPHRNNIVAPHEESKNFLNQAVRFGRG